MKYENTIKVISKMVKDFLKNNGGDDNVHFTNIKIRLTTETAILGSLSLVDKVGDWKTPESDDLPNSQKRMLFKELVGELILKLNKDFKNLINFIDIRIEEEYRYNGYYPEIKINVGWLESCDLELDSDRVDIEDNPSEAFTYPGK